MRNNRNIIIAMSIIMVLIAGAAVMAVLVRQADQNKKTATTDQSKQTSPEQNAETPAASITIVYTDNGFEPDTYMAAVGDNIAVVNNSSREFEFSSNDHPSHVKEPELNLTPLQPGQSAMFTVTKAGTWGFHDHFRAGFMGTLKVSEKK